MSYQATRLRFQHCANSNVVAISYTPHGALLLGLLALSGRFLAKRADVVVEMLSSWSGRRSKESRCKKPVFEVRFHFSALAAESAYTRPGVQNRSGCYWLSSHLETRDRGIKKATPKCSGNGRKKLLREWYLYIKKYTVRKLALSLAVGGLVTLLQESEAEVCEKEDQILVSFFFFFVHPSATEKEGRSLTLFCPS
jgi:hypothetical protein